MRENNIYTKTRLFWLVALRALIGWYFLYEGLAKMLNLSWTAQNYLMDSKGWFAPLFISMGENPAILSAVNFINIYGLALVGLSLMLGLFSRQGHWGAILFLALFYLSHPPLISVKYLLPPEGSYLWVDKNLIMLVATIVSMLFPTSQIVGLDRAILRKTKKH